MDTLKLLLFTAICSLMLTSCSASKNHEETVSTVEPQETTATDKVKDAADSVGDGAGDIIETQNGEMFSFRGADVDMKNKTITIK